MKVFEFLCTFALRIGTNCNYFTQNALGRSATKGRGEARAGRDAGYAGVKATLMQQVNINVLEIYICSIYIQNQMSATVQSNIFFALFRKNLECSF